MNGDLVRKQWYKGLRVSFKPKGFISSEALKGVIIGHLYVNVLIIKGDDGNEWLVSVFRCEPLDN